MDALNCANNTFYNFTARPYQRSIERIWYIQTYYISFGTGVHEKDKTTFQALIKKALERKGCLLLYISKEYEQGRKAFWDNIDNDGGNNVWSRSKRDIQGKQWPVNNFEPR